MESSPRIRLDSTRLLGFQQVKGARPGSITGPRAMVGAVTPVTPEPSTYVELVVGIVTLGLFLLYKRHQARKGLQTQTAGAETGPQG